VAIELFPRRNFILVADNRNVVRVFTIGNENATLVSSYRLSKPLGSEHESVIASIYITKNEHVAVVSFENGLVSAYDIRGGFTWIGDVNKETFRLTTTASAASPTLCKVIEKEDV
jgi:hypothetical protein